MKNRNKLISIARILRHNKTDTERHLWKLLKSKNVFGFKFRQQAPIGSYVVDFVCFEKKVIIECDGGQHAESVSQDYKRDKWLESQGFHVLRFWNHDVLQNKEGVLEIISRACTKATPSPESPPIKGGEV